MAIATYPPELAWTLQWLAGTELPLGNEDIANEMKRSFEGIEQFLLEETLPKIDRAIQLVENNYSEGQGGEAVRKDLQVHREYAEGLSAGFGDLAESIHGFAGQTVAAKLSGHFAMSWFAAEMLWATTLGPAGLGVKAQAIVSARLAFNMIGRTLLRGIEWLLQRLRATAAAVHVISKAAYEVVQEGIIEALQTLVEAGTTQTVLTAQGYQESWKMNELLRDVAVAAVSGGAGGATGHGLNQALNKLPWGPDKLGGAARGLITGTGANLVGSGVATILYGMMTGHYDWSPLALTSAVASSAPSVFNGWRGVADYSGAPGSRRNPFQIGRQEPPIGGDGTGTLSGTPPDPGGSGTPSAPRPGGAAPAAPGAGGGPAGQASARTEPGGTAARVSATGSDGGKYTARPDGPNSAPPDRGDGSPRDDDPDTTADGAPARPGAGLPPDASTAPGGAASAPLGAGQAGLAADGAADIGNTVTGGAPPGTSGAAPTAAGGSPATGSATGSTTASAPSDGGTRSNPAAGTLGPSTAAPRAGPHGSAITGSAGSGVRSSPARGPEPTGSPDSTGERTGATDPRAGAAPATDGSDKGITAGRTTHEARTNTPAPAAPGAAGTDRNAGAGADLAGGGPGPDSAAGPRAGSSGPSVAPTTSGPRADTPPGDAAPDDPVAPGPGADSDIATPDFDEAGQNAPHLVSQLAGMFPDADITPMGRAGRKGVSTTELGQALGSELQGSETLRGTTPRQESWRLKMRADEEHGRLADAGHAIQGAARKRARKTLKYTARVRKQVSAERNSVSRRISKIEKSVKDWESQQAELNRQLQSRLTELQDQRDRAQNPPPVSDPETGRPVPQSVDQEALRALAETDARLRAETAARVDALGRKIDAGKRRIELGQRDRMRLEARLDRLKKMGYRVTEAQQRAQEQARPLFEHADSERERLLDLAAARRIQDKSAFRKASLGARIIEQSEEVGEGGAVVCVYRYAEVDEYGREGRGVTIYQRDGVVMIYDPAKKKPEIFDPDYRPPGLAEKRELLIAAFRADGTPVNPLVTVSIPGNDDEDPEKSLRHLRDLQAGDTEARSRSAMAALRTEHTRVAGELGDRADAADLTPDQLDGLRDPDRFPGVLAGLTDPGSAVSAEESARIQEARTSLRELVPRYHALDAALRTLGSPRGPDSSLQQELLRRHAVAVLDWSSSLGDLATFAGRIPGARVDPLVSGRAEAEITRLGEAGISEERLSQLRAAAARHDLLTGQMHTAHEESRDPVHSVRSEQERAAERARAVAIARLETAVTQLEANLQIALGELVTVGRELRLSDTVLEKLTTPEFELVLRDLPDSERGWRALTANAHYHHELAAVLQQTKVVLEQVRDGASRSRRWSETAARQAGLATAYATALRDTRNATVTRVSDLEISQVISDVLGWADSLESNGVRLGRETLDRGSVAGVSDRGLGLDIDLGAMAGDVVVLDGRPVRFAVLAEDAPAEAVTAAHRSVRSARVAHKPGAPLGDVDRTRMVTDALAAAQAAAGPGTSLTLAVALLESGTEPGSYVAGRLGAARLDLLDPADPETSQSLTFSESAGADRAQSTDRAVASYPAISRGTLADHQILLLRNAGWDASVAASALAGSFAGHPGNMPAAVGEIIDIARASGARGGLTGVALSGSAGEVSDLASAGARPGRAPEGTGPADPTDSGADSGPEMRTATAPETTELEAGVIAALGGEIAGRAVVLGRAAMDAVFGQVPSARRTVELSVLDADYAALRALPQWTEQSGDSGNFLRNGDYSIVAATDSSPAHRDTLSRAWRTPGGLNIAGLPDVYAQWQDRDSSQDRSDAAEIRQRLLDPSRPPLPPVVLAHEIEAIWRVLPAEAREHSAAPDAVHLAAGGLYIAYTLYGDPRIGRTNQIVGSLERPEYGVPATYHNGFDLLHDAESLVRHLRNIGATPLECLDAVVAEMYSDAVYGNGRHSNDPDGYDELKSAELARAHADALGYDRARAERIHAMILGTAFDEVTKAQRGKNDPDPLVQALAGTDLKTLSEAGGLRAAMALAVEDLMSERYPASRILGRALEEAGLRIRSVDEGIAAVDALADWRPMIDGKRSEQTVMEAFAQRLARNANFTSGHQYPPTWSLDDPEMRTATARRSREVSGALSAGLTTATREYARAGKYAADITERFHRPDDAEGNRVADDRAVPPPAAAVLGADPAGPLPRDPQAALADLVAYHRARRDVKAAAGRLREAKEQDEAAYADEIEPRPEEGRPGPEEARLRGPLRSSLARMYEIERRIEPFAEELGAGRPGGLTSRQHQQLLDLGVAVAGWRDAKNAVAQEGPDSTTEGRRGVDEATRQIHEVVRRLAADPVLHTLAQLDEGWGPVSGDRTTADSGGPVDYRTMDLGEVYGVSDLGANAVNEHNHDWMEAAVVSYPGGESRIAVVADGVGRDEGAHRAAEEAARVVRAQLAHFAFRKQGVFTRVEAEEAMRAAILAAQDRVATVTSDHTTVAAALTQHRTDGAPNQLIAGWVGDSRIDLLRATGDSAAISRDHSDLAYLTDLGMTQREALRESEGGILHSLGVGAGPPAADDAVNARFVASRELAPGDIVSVSTDGIWSADPDVEDRAVVLDGGQNSDLRNMAWRLRHRALLSGGEDNASIVLISGAPPAEPIPDTAGVVDEGDTGLPADLRAGRRIGEPRIPGTDVPPGLRGGYRNALAAQDSARKALDDLAAEMGPLPVTVAQLVGPDHDNALAALDRHTEGPSDAGEPTHGIELLGRYTKKYHEAEFRLRRIEERIRAHGDGVDSADARPRPTFPDDRGTTEAQRVRAVRRWQTIQGYGGTLADTARLWRLTDSRTQQALIQIIPEEIARTPALPPPARDEASRLVLRRVRNGLHREGPDSAARVAADAHADRLAAAERWAAQIPGHPAVQLLDPAASAMIFGDLDAADEVRFHTLGEDLGTAAAPADRDRVTAAAIDDLARAGRRAATVVLPAVDSAEFAGAVAEILDARVARGGALPEVVLIGHEAAGSPDPGPGGDTRMGGDLVSRAREDPALGRYRDLIEVAATQSGVAHWMPTHRIEGVANDCVVRNGSGLLNRLAFRLERHGSGDPATIEELRRRAEELSRAVVPSSGFSGPATARAMGGDWSQREFRNPADLAAAVPEGGAMLAAVEFAGFRRHGVAGAHAVQLYREGDRVYVIDEATSPERDENRVEFAVWSARIGPQVVGWYGIAFGKDGRPEISLPETGESAAIAGRDYPNTGIAGYSPETGRGPPDARVSDPPDEQDRRLAAYALARGSGADGDPGGAEAATRLLPPVDASVSDSLGARYFAALGRKQALDNLAWWRGLSDDAIPDNLRGRSAQDGLEDSGLELTGLQRALLRVRPELLATMPGLPDEVSTQAALRALNARLRILEEKSRSGDAFTVAESREYSWTPDLIDSLTRDSGGLPPYLRNLDPVTGEVVFVYGDMATADRRVYVVPPTQAPNFTVDYYEARVTAERIHTEIQRMQPGARVAVAAWARGAGFDDSGGAALRGALLRRDITVDLAVQRPDSGNGRAAAESGPVVPYAVITFGAAASVGHAIADDAGLHTLYMIDPDGVLPSAAPPPTVSMYTTYTHKNQLRTASERHAGRRLAAVDGAYRPARVREGKPDPLSRMMARIGLDRDMSRYLPELSDRFGGLVPETRTLPKGNRVLVALGAEDVFRAPDGPLDWRAFEADIGGRLVPVVVKSSEYRDAVDQILDDLSKGYVRNDEGLVQSGVRADVYTVVLGSGSAVYRVEMAAVGDEVVVVDPLVGGPLVADLWQELRLHRTDLAAWVIAHRTGADGVLRPVIGALHDPKFQHPGMPAYLIGSTGIDAPHAERIPGKLVISLRPKKPNESTEKAAVPAGKAEVSTGGDVLIGRSAVGAKLFELLGDVSRNHARVGVFRNGELWIEDNGSRHGTFVNGTKLARGERRVIAKTDTIRLGANSEISLDFKPDRLLPAEVGRDESAGRLQAAAAETSVMVLHSSYGPGSDVPIQPGRDLVIGRENSPLADRLTQYPDISRRHATIGLDESGRVWIRDEGSTNGTFVDEKPIPRGENLIVGEHAVIRLGRNYRLVLQKQRSGAPDGSAGAVGEVLRPAGEEAGARSPGPQPHRVAWDGSRRRHDGDEGGIQRPSQYRTPDPNWYASGVSDDEPHALNTSAPGDGAAQRDIPVAGPELKWPRPAEVPRLDSDHRPPLDEASDGDPEAAARSKVAEHLQINPSNIVPATVLRAVAQLQKRLRELDQRGWDLISQNERTAEVLPVLGRLTEHEARSSQSDYARPVGKMLSEELDAILPTKAPDSSVPARTDDLLDELRRLGERVHSIRIFVNDLSYYLGLAVTSTRRPAHPPATSPASPAERELLLVLQDLGHRPAGDLDPRQRRQREFAESLWTGIRSAERRLRTGFGIDVLSIDWEHRVAQVGLSPTVPDIGDSRSWFVRVDELDMAASPGSPSWIDRLFTPGPDAGALEVYPGRRTAGPGFDIVTDTGGQTAGAVDTARALTAWLHSENWGSSEQIEAAAGIVEKLVEAGGSRARVAARISGEDTARKLIVEVVDHASSPRPAEPDRPQALDDTGEVLAEGRRATWLAFHESLLVRGLPESVAKAELWDRFDSDPGAVAARRALAALGGDAAVRPNYSTDGPLLWPEGVIGTAVPGPGERNTGYTAALAASADDIRALGLGVRKNTPFDGPSQQLGALFVPSEIAWMEQIGGERLEHNGIHLVALLYSIKASVYSATEMLFPEPIPERRIQVTVDLEARIFEARLLDDPRDLDGAPIEVIGGSWGVRDGIAVAAAAVPVHARQISRPDDSPPPVPDTRPAAAVDPDELLHRREQREALRPLRDAAAAKLNIDPGTQTDLAPLLQELATLEQKVKEGRGKPRSALTEEQTNARTRYSILRDFLEYERRMRSLDTAIGDENPVASRVETDELRHQGTPHPAANTSERPLRHDLGEDTETGIAVLPSMRQKRNNPPGAVGFASGVGGDEPNALNSPRSSQRRQDGATSSGPPASATVEPGSGTAEVPLIVPEGQLELSADGRRMLADVVQERRARVDRCIVGIRNLRNLLEEAVDESGVYSTAPFVSQIQAQIEDVLERRISDFLGTERGREDQKIAQLSLLVEKQHLSVSEMRLLSNLLSSGGRNIVGLLPGARNRYVRALQASARKQLIELTQNRSFMESTDADRAAYKLKSLWSGPIDTFVDRIPTGSNKTDRERLIDYLASLERLRYEELRKFVDPWEKISDDEITPLLSELVQGKLSTSDLFRDIERIQRARPVNANISNALKNLNKWLVGKFSEASMAGVSLDSADVERIANYVSIAADLGSRLGVSSDFPDKLEEMRRLRGGQLDDYVDRASTLYCHFTPNIREIALTGELRSGRSAGVMATTNAVYSDGVHFIKPGRWMGIENYNWYIDYSSKTKSASGRFIPGALGAVIVLPLGEIIRHTPLRSEVKTTSPDGDHLSSDSVFRPLGNSDQYHYPLDRAYIIPCYSGRQLRQGEWFGSDWSEPSSEEMVTDPVRRVFLDAGYDINWVDRHVIEVPDMILSDSLPGNPEMYARMKRQLRTAMDTISDRIERESDSRADYIVPVSTQHGQRLEALDEHGLPRNHESFESAIELLAPAAGRIRNQVNHETVLSAQSSTAPLRILEDPGFSGDGPVAGPGSPWGLFGAGGALVRHVDEQGVPRYLMLKMSEGYSQANWQIPGGAKGSKETAANAAARELFEEAGVTQKELDRLQIVGSHIYEHPIYDWTYETVVVDAPGAFELRVDGREAVAGGWFTEEQIRRMNVHNVLKSNMPSLLQVFSGSARLEEADWGMNTWVENSSVTDGVARWKKPATQHRHQPPGAAGRPPSQAAAEGLIEDSSWDDRRGSGGRRGASGLDFKSNLVEGFTAFRHEPGSGADWTDGAARGEESIRERPSTSPVYEYGYAEERSDAELARLRRLRIEHRYYYPLGNKVTPGGTSLYPEGRPAYYSARHRLGSGVYLYTLTVRLHLGSALDVTSDDRQGFVAELDMVVDRYFNTGIEIFDGHHLLVDVEIVSDPADANLHVDLVRESRAVGNPWSVDLSPDRIARELRRHLGLVPWGHGGEMALSADDLGAIRRSICDANTHQRFPDLESSRVYGPGELRELEEPKYQSDLEDALREGFRFAVGADPRSHPYGQMINGPHGSRGRTQNCIDCTLSGLSSFLGSPLVAVPTWRDYEANFRGDMSLRPEVSLGAAWQEPIARSSDDAYWEVHRHVEEMGQGSAALVRIRWVAGGGHQTLVVYPVDATGPVWWDPQSGETSDTPPPNYVERSKSLTFILVPPDEGVDLAGDPALSNEQRSGAVSALPTPLGPDMQHSGDGVRLGVPTGTDQRSGRQRDEEGPAELRGEQGDRGDHRTPDHAVGGDRTGVRRGDPQGPAGAGRSDLPADMAGVDRGDAGDRDGDPVSGPRTIVDGTAGAGRRPLVDNPEELFPDGNGHGDDSRGMQRSGSLGGVPEPGNGLVAPNRDVRVLGPDGRAEFGGIPPALVPRRRLDPDSPPSLFTPNSTERHSPHGAVEFASGAGEDGLNAFNSAQRVPGTAPAESQRKLVRMIGAGLPFDLIAEALGPERMERDLEVIARELGVRTRDDVVSTVREQGPGRFGIPVRDPNIRGGAGSGDGHRSDGTKADGDRLAPDAGEMGRRAYAKVAGLPAAEIPPPLLQEDPGDAKYRDFFVTTRDGRRLAVRLEGPADGMPLLYLHGTPGNRAASLRKDDVLQITYDRPGFGDSDRNPGRQMIDNAYDVEDIMNFLEIEKFAVLAYSGGTGTALAATAIMPERVTKVVAGVPQAPMGSFPEWGGNMSSTNLEMYQADYQRLVEIFRPKYEAFVEDPDNIEAIVGAGRSKDHKKMHDDPERRAATSLDFQRSFKNGPWGYIDDARAVSHPFGWGFDVRSIKKANIMIVAASADKFSPPTHAEWLRKNVGRDGDVRIFLHIFDAGHLVTGLTMAGQLHWLKTPPELRTSYDPARSRQIISSVVGDWDSQAVAKLMRAERRSRSTP
ncbi:alpha/beta fold hydrolase [Nocardia flavorosea]|uniref:alpha/beta fold hydrolase n=1 Tax=Nocardia flavorosea TaxID=53429 RepID=UPI0024579E53|nr:alpha/beta fold hydrolase [Nocardia flavorosea]